MYTVAMQSFKGINSAFDQLVLILKKFILCYLVCFAYSMQFSASPFLTKDMTYA
jgi:hypothetical protein